MPGVIIGGKDLEHDCGLQRGIGYFLEPLILLGLFARSPMSIRLKGDERLLNQFVPELFRI
jgi:RNA 3'-terminal phosphate cyclase-like protein